MLRNPIGRTDFAPQPNFNFAANSYWGGVYSLEVRVIYIYIHMNIYIYVSLNVVDFHGVCRNSIEFDELSPKLMELQCFCYEHSLNLMEFHGIRRNFHAFDGH